MTDKIMQDNQMYLTQWMRYNPSISEYNTLEGNFLVSKDGEKLDISKIYLPEILYNEAFRQDVSNALEMSGFDFFQIIYFCLACIDHAEIDMVASADLSYKFSFQHIQRLASQTAQADDDSRSGG